MLSCALLVCSALGASACDGESEPSATDDTSSDQGIDAPALDTDDSADGMVPDTTPGTLDVDFLNLRVEELTHVRGVVRFETSIPTTCAVVWGTTEDELDNVSVDPDMAEGELSADHNVPLEDLSPSTTYYWRGYVEVDDQSATSELQSFTTLPGPGTGPELENVALPSAGTTVVGVSSNFGGGANDSTWGVDHAIDGMMSTEWATNGDGDDAWFELDLGEMREISHVGFRSRKMTDGTSIISGFQLVTRASADGPETTLGPFDAADPDERYEFELESPTTMRFVRLEAVQTTGGNTGVKELELLVPTQ